MSLQSTSGTSYGYGSWSTVYPPNHSLPAPPNMENSQNGCQGSSGGYHTEPCDKARMYPTDSHQPPPSPRLPENADTMDLSCGSPSYR
ncbi:unnamed protein product [Heligmosomoides polygyrus]|uniref:Retinoic acid-induced protein 1 n=1 Tax=Heligmosomoides polygyrus TaxID=6339 RepID=A0A183GNV8_HELPZ|nr:unnamed protein product [Heligmosomoides polygyrus]